MRKLINRRTFLRATATTTALSAPIIAAAEAAPTPTPIEKLFARWLVVRDFESPDEEEFGRVYQEYVALQTSITTAEPRTARDVAIQLYAETDAFGSDETKAFRERIIRLAETGRA